MSFRCMWDLESGKKTVDFPAHDGDVVSISLSPDGNTYVTGSVDKTCRLWDIREQKPKQTFFGHQSDVNSVCVSFWNGHQLLYFVSKLFSSIQVDKHL